MNLTEQKMVQVLKELKERFFSSGVKAEFEAEGTRTEELMRLKEICLAAEVSLTLKVGGCEAVRDMYDARAVGVDYLVAPMVETPFALRKFFIAIDTAFPVDEQEEVEFLINIETLQAVQQFDAMLKLPNIGKLDGVVLGRVDLVGSMGLDRAAVNSPEVFKIAQELLGKTKTQGLSCVLGGAISLDSLDFLRKLPKGLIDRYETRKVCFNAPEALGSQAEEGILKAVEFELLWLENKRSFYKAISEEDDKRITMLQKRLGKING